jgi:hypothetical protein
MISLIGDDAFDMMHLPLILNKWLGCTNVVNLPIHHHFSVSLVLQFQTV